MPAMALRGDNTASTRAPGSIEPASPGEVGPLPDDWPRQATQQIVRVVDTVRDKTTGPILGVARGVVYGLVAVAAAVIMLVLLTIAVIRGLTTVLDRVWVVYLLVGAAYLVGGFWAWARRQPRPATVGADGNNHPDPEVP